MATEEETVWIVDSESDCILVTRDGLYAQGFGEYMSALKTRIDKLEDFIQLPGGKTERLIGEKKGYFKKVIVKICYEYPNTMSSPVHLFPVYLYRIFPSNHGLSTTNLLSRKNNAPL